MNRTQRARKKSCHKAYAHAKREKHLALYEMKEANFYNFDEKSKKLKEAVKYEKDLKAWHRKIVSGIYSNSKEEKTA